MGRLKNGRNPFSGSAAFFGDRESPRTIALRSARTYKTGLLSRQKDDYGLRGGAGVPARTRLCPAPPTLAPQVAANYARRHRLVETGYGRRNPVHFKGPYGFSRKTQAYPAYVRPCAVQITRPLLFPITLSVKPEMLILSQLF